MREGWQIRTPAYTRQGSPPFGPVDNAEQCGGGHADSGSGYVQDSRTDEARLDQLPYLLGSWPRLGHVQDRARSRRLKAGRRERRLRRVHSDAVRAAGVARSGTALGGRDTRKQPEQMTEHGNRN